MIRSGFRRKIEKHLVGFNKKQTVEFVWRCGIRALPFIGERGNFKYWKKDDVQVYLYSVFHALDISKFGASAYASAKAAAYAAAKAADVAAYASANASAAAAAAAAASAAAANAAVAVAANAAAAAAYYNIDLQKVIIEDLEKINKSEPQSISTKIYGKIWDNFQLALKNESCEYWSMLYQKIFDNNFDVDVEALNKRINVPKEIKDQGASAVGNYLQALEKGSRRLTEARVIILGDKGAGKTCVARRLVNPKALMTTDQESTAGVDTFKWELQGQQEINVGIWDFAGHTVTHAVHQFFLSERCLYIMVYDGRTEERNRLVYWLNHMKNFGGDSKAIILVNKRDKHSVDIPINYLKEQYPIAGIYNFSVRDDAKELEKFRKDVAYYMENNPSWKKQDIPISYYQVKEELENFFHKPSSKKKKEHISKKQFDQIAEKYEVADKEQLLKDLHALGVSLWYEGMDKYDTLVLNPEWISHGVYSIVNWVSNEKKHYLNIDEFKTVFAKNIERYPDIKSHQFLFDLMKHYELAYETKGDANLIIPHLLKEDRPKELPYFPIEESLKIKYEAKQPLPPNSISRFIVRHHKQIKDDSLVWRYGVVLIDGNGSVALVREEDRSISVSVKGKDKTNYISELRLTLNDIFNSYKSEKPELQYSVLRFGLIPERLNSSNELWLPESKIYNHVAVNEPYFDDVTLQRYPLEKTVNLYKIEATNLFMGNSQVHNLTQNTFSFKDCNIDLQADLNDLSQLLSANGSIKESKQLEDAAKLLELAESVETIEEVKKKGIANRLKRIVKDLGDKNSKLHKVVAGLEHGIGIAQDIAKRYNSIAQWVGMPVIPPPLLGGGKEEKNKESQ